MTYLAFVLDSQSRARLLNEVPARFSNVIAHHVTLLFPRKPGEDATMRRMMLQLVDQEHEVEVINRYDGEHIHAVGVKFNGETKRSNGGFYHVTVSLEPPAKPKDSNSLTKPVSLNPFKLTGKVQLVD